MLRIEQIYGCHTLNKDTVSKGNFPLTTLSGRHVRYTVWKYRQHLVENQVTCYLYYKVIKSHHVV